MKRNYLLSIILCFSFIFSFINNEAFAGNKKDSGSKGFSIDSLMKNMEIDVKLWFLHAPSLRDGRIQSALPNV